jgi:integrase
MRELQKWRLACPQIDLNFDVFRKAGEPISDKNLYNRHFKPVLKMAGIVSSRIHDLRLTYTSFQIEQGENITYIRTQLGHTNPSVTLNVTAHLIKPHDQSAASGWEGQIVKQRVARW